MTEKLMMEESEPLPGSLLRTGNRPENIRDQNLHQGLVQEVVAAPHPGQDGLVFAEGDQLVSREDGFVGVFAAKGKAGEPFGKSIRAAPLPKNPSKDSSLHSGPALPRAELKYRWTSPYDRSLSDPLK